MNRRLARAAAALLVVLATGVAGAQDPTRLTLTDEQGRPLADARLLEAHDTVQGRPIVDPQRAPLARSDEAGVLTLPEARPRADGPGLVLVAAGRAPRRLEAAAPPAAVALSAGRAASGRVRWAGGREAARVRVVLLPSAPGGVGLEVPTDEQGRYRTDLLAEGGYQLLLRRADGRLLTLAQVAGPSQATEAVAPVPGGLKGRLIDARASGTTGAAGVSLRLVPLPRERGGAPIEARTDAEGRFLALDAPAGVYDVELLDSAWCFDQPVARTDVPGEGLVREASWFVARRARVLGRALGARSEGLPGAQVRLLGDPRTPRWPSAPEEPVPSAVCDLEGRFVLERLRPTPGARLLVVAQGYAPFLSEPFDVVGSGDTTLKPARLVPGWELEVEVRDVRARPAPGLTVRIAATRHPGATVDPALAVFAAQAATDDQGRARFTGLADEDYLLTLRAPGALPVDLVVEVPRGSAFRRQRVSLEAAPALAGRVSHAAGTPAAGLEVALGLRGRSGAGVRAVTAADGGFRFDDLGPEPVDLDVLVGGRRLLRVEALTPGGPPLDLVLPEPALLAGVVSGIDPQGSPAQVWLEAQEPAEEERPAVWSVVERLSLPGGLARAPFSFRGLAPGIYAVRCAQGAQDAEASPVRLEGAGAVDVDLRLPEASSVAGSVLDARGAPSVGARVTLTRLAGTGETPLQGAVARVAATDDRGGYQFGSVGPGLWRVEVREAGLGADAEVLRVLEGEALAVRDLSLSAGAVLEGVVRDRLDRPVDGARVACEPIDGTAPPLLALTAGDGRYRAEGLLGGTYRVRVDVGLGGRQLREALVSLAAGERRTLDFVAAARGRIEGTVLRGGNRAAAVSVQARWEAAEGSALRRVERVLTDGQGAFAFDGLEAGRYQLVLEDGTTRTGGEVDLGEDDRVLVDLELWEGRLTGRVLGADGRAVARAHVVARPSVPVVGLLTAEATSDPDGRFVLSGLPVGRYDLTVSSEGRRPARLAGAQADPPGADRPVTVLLGLGAVVDVDVRGSDGRALAGARLSVRALGTLETAVVVATTGPSGRVRLEGVPEGRVEVEAYARDLGRAYGTVDAVEGAFAALTLKLEPPGSLALSLEGVPTEALDRVQVEVRRPERSEPVLTRRWLPLPSFPLTSRAAVLNLRDLAPGEYEVGLEAGPRYGRARVRVLVRSTQETAVHLKPVR